MHFRSYFEEAVYIYQKVPSWSGKLSLFGQTLAFHVNNGLRRRNAGTDKVEFSLLIGSHLSNIRLRPNRGDLFILYEVLARQAYLIPDEIIPPNEVKVILDCGANIGLTALFFLNKYPNARIFCIEPDPENFRILVENVAEHDRIIAIQAAVVGRKGNVHLSRDRPAYGNSIEQDAREGSTVEVTGITIGDICTKHHIEDIDILKVDIEGAEKDVFDKPSFLPKVRFIAIELHKPYDIDEFSRVVRPFGFSVEAPDQAFCRHAHLAFRKL